MNLVKLLMGVHTKRNPTFKSSHSAQATSGNSNRQQQRNITTMMKIVSALLLLTVGLAAADDGELFEFPIFRFLDVGL